MYKRQIQNENRIEKPAAKPKAAAFSFARGLNFYKLFWVFFIGCFLGVVVETLFYLVTEFRFTNRTGLLYGPFNLVYGFGALLMTKMCIRDRRRICRSIRSGSFSQAHQSTGEGHGPPEPSPLSLPIRCRSTVSYTHLGVAAA